MLFSLDQRAEGPLSPRGEGCKCTKKAASAAIIRLPSEIGFSSAFWDGGRLRET